MFRSLETQALSKRNASISLASFFAAFIVLFILVVPIMRLVEIKKKQHKK